jgi:hypothetical protein
MWRFGVLNLGQRYRRRPAQPPPADECGRAPRRAAQIHTFTPQSCCRSAVPVAVWCLKLGAEMPPPTSIAASCRRVRTGAAPRSTDPHHTVTPQSCCRSAVPVAVWCLKLGAEIPPPTSTAASCRRVRTGAAPRSTDPHPLFAIR